MRLKRCEHSFASMVELAPQGQRRSAGVLTAIRQSGNRAQTDIHHGIKVFDAALCNLALPVIRAFEQSANFWNIAAMRLCPKLSKSGKLTGTGMQCIPASLKRNRRLYRRCGGHAHGAHLTGRKR